MFTGIVTGIGRIAQIERLRGGARIRVTPPPRYGRFSAGESVNVSGVCLTAIERGRELVADLSRETVKRTTLARLRPGDTVNLERSLRFGDRVCGHYVLGHVDGVVRLVSCRQTGSSWLYRFSIPSRLGRFVVPKGSVALDGISLTVASRRERRFDVAVIPETRRRTTLGDRKSGDFLNFEIDYFARYLRRGGGARA